jgi:acyl carrier protein
MSSLDGIDDFLGVVRAELGLDVHAADVDTELVNIPDWDSVYLLRLVTLLEEHAGRRVSVRAVLEARSLGQIHALVTEAPPAETPAGPRL